MRADLLIIDGRHLLWRSCDAFQQLSIELEDGSELGTGGMYGFISVLLRVHNKYGGTPVIAWEGSGNFRYGLYKQYKKKDVPPTEEHMELVDEMSQQELRLKALLRLLGVPQYEAVGFEADDVIGTLAAKAAARGLTTGIYSGDGDLRQLVCDKTFTISPGFKGSPDKLYTKAAEVIAKDLVDPSLIPDLKALSGDNSDNIPGVYGIGPKTAAKAIQECGSVEAVVKAAQDGGKLGIPERFREPIVENADKIAMYKRLATIVCDATMRQIKPARDAKRVRMHFMAYKFRSLTEPAEWIGLMRLGKREETETAA